MLSRQLSGSHTRSQTAWWKNEAEHNQVFGDWQTTGRASWNQRIRATSAEEVESHKQPVSQERKAKGEVWKVRQSSMLLCLVLLTSLAPSKLMNKAQSTRLSASTVAQCGYTQRTNTATGLERGNISSPATAYTGHQTSPCEGHLYCPAPPWHGICQTLLNIRNFWVLVWKTKQTPLPWPRGTKWEFPGLGPGTVNSWWAIQAILFREGWETVL